ncbi:hypothetical protein BC826DRAFT_975005 [Russula brevipes]|nr:hypothetical protein BC826DRAFT_975005 [Russula brevipes]
MPRARTLHSSTRLPAPAASPHLVLIDEVANAAAPAVRLHLALIDKVASAAAPAVCPHLTLIDKVANMAAPAMRPHLALIDEVASAAAPATRLHLTLIDEVASAAAPAACLHLAHLVLSLNPSTPLLLSTSTWGLGLLSGLDKPKKKPTKLSTHLNPVEECASPPPEPHVVLTHDPRETAPCGVEYPRVFLHPGSGEPTWEGGPGQNLDMCMTPLTAIPSHDTAITSNEKAVEVMINPRTYFQGNVQQALWHLGDYGVTADAWRLFSNPQREQTLADRKLRLQRLEALVQEERQGYHVACDKAKEEIKGARVRLHHAGLVERVRPYLKHDKTIGEQHIHPAELRGCQSHNLAQ